MHFSDMCVPSLGVYYQNTVGENDNFLAVQVAQIK